VLADPAFRARFRRDPEAALREAGLEPVEGRAFETLELRESKSSLAGALMAAAAEGLALYEVVDHGGLGADAAQAAVERAPSSALAIAQNPNIELDATGVADLRAGRIDPRIVALLEEASKDHRITVSSLKSDHGVRTAGGSISNHYYGRAVDIAMVDGRPVAPGNEAARELAAALLRLDPRIRPTELGSPWAFGNPAAFTDGDHQDHIHVAFDDPIDPRQRRAILAHEEPDGQVQHVDEPGVAPTPDEDAESDGPDAPDEDADEEDDSDDDEDDSDDADDSDDEDEDEDEPDEVGPDIDDLTDDEVVEDESDGSDGSDEPDASDGLDDSGGSGDATGDGGDVPDLGDISSEYPGDDAPREEIAAWMAGEAQRRGLPPELPVMAALVESGLQNLPGGDADSVGFFQMRASIWNSGPYAGYADRPELQLDWFLDHAKEVGGRVGDPSGYGEWIADVERPAEQYRGRYQERLEEARQLLRRARPPVEELADGVGGGTHAGSHARAALAEAKKYLGTPYLWGGSTPKTGFDCSGLVQWAYAKAGIRIPRVTDQQILAEGATKVGRRRLLPGDLVFFRDDTGYVHHVGMSLGGDKFIHAPHTGDVVKISSLKEPYYAEQFAGGRRFDPAVARPVDSPIDEHKVARARVALEHDAAEVARPGTALFRAIEAQEAYKNGHTQVLTAIRPDQLRRS
jgi:hypothetical protein